MSAPADSLARGDAVLWRWPAGPWEWLRAGAWAWNSRWLAALLAPLIGLALVIVLAAGFMGGAATLREGADDALLQTGLVLLVVIVFAGAPPALALAFGCLRVQQLTLTAGEVRMTTRFPWRREKTVPRSDIRSVVIYEGDGTVVLLAGEGELLRARHVTKAAAFAEALAAPTLAWPVRKQDKANKWLSGAEAACFIVLQFALCVVTLILISIFAGASIGFLPLVFGSMAGGTIMGVLLAPIPVLAIGRRFVSPRTLDEFIARGIELARWQGRRWIWPDIAFAAGTRLAIRILRIAPPPPLQPELRHGATPGLAAALAAEGAG